MARSNKMPLDWHRQCARATRVALADYERRLADLQQTVDRLRADADSYDSQIVEAERRGVDGFDRERFMRSRQA